MGSTKPKDVAELGLDTTLRGSGFEMRAVVEFVDWSPSSSGGGGRGEELSLRGSCGEPRPFVD